MSSAATTIILILVSPSLKILRVFSPSFSPEDLSRSSSPERFLAVFHLSSTHTRRSNWVFYPGRSLTVFPLSYPLSRLLTMAHPRAANQQEEAEEEGKQKKSRSRRAALQRVWLHPGAIQALSGLPGVNNEGHSWAPKILTHNTTMPLSPAVASVSKSYQIIMEFCYSNINSMLKYNCNRERVNSKFINWKRL